MAEFGLLRLSTKQVNESSVGSNPTLSATLGGIFMESNNKGDPRVTSDTKGQEITPDNPETIKQFPVDLTDKKAVKKVEGDAPPKKA